MSKFVVGAFVVCGVVLAAAAAYAQPGTYYPPPPPPGQYGYYAPPPPPPPGPIRDGLVLGFGLGGGAISCEDCDDSLGAAGGEFHIGGMLTPQLALLFDASVLIHELENTNGATLSQVVNVGALQFWPTSRIWIKGGIGFGRMEVTDSEGYAVGRSEVGGAVMVAAGIELYQNSAFALDVQGRFASVKYDDFDQNITNGSILVGFNWY